MNLFLRLTPWLVGSLLLASQSHAFGNLLQQLAPAAGSGKPGISGMAAADAARIQAQYNTPIPAAQLQQFPPAVADLNRDGIVTHGEVMQVQSRGLPQFQSQRLPGASYPPAYNGYQPGYAQGNPAAGAVGQMAAPALNQAGNQAGAALGQALGGMIGGLFGGGSGNAGDPGKHTPPAEAPADGQPFGDY